MDRRVKKTKRAIFEAFLTMVKDKPVHKISVSELAERADINRKTFYLHFSDIFELEKLIKTKFNEGAKKLISTIALSEFPNSEMNFVDDLFEKMNMVSLTFKNVTHTDFFHDLLRGAVESVGEELVDGYKEKGGADLQKLSYYYTFILNGIVELYLKWIQTDSLDDQQLIKECLNEFINFEYLSHITN